MKSALIAALAIVGASASNTRLRAPNGISDCPKKNGEEEGRVLDCKKGRLFFVAVLFSSAVFVMHLTHRFPLPHTQSKSLRRRLAAASRPRTSSVRNSGLSTATAPKKTRSAQS